jgi:hypothetical protein
MLRRVDSLEDEVPGFGIFINQPTRIGDIIVVPSRAQLWQRRSFLVRPSHSIEYLPRQRARDKVLPSCRLPKPGGSIAIDLGPVLRDPDLSRGEPFRISDCSAKSQPSLRPLSHRAVLRVPSSALD